MAVAKSLKSHKPRGIMFRDAFAAIKSAFRISRESFWMMVADWRKNAKAKSISHGVECLAVGLDFVLLFMNEKGCLVAVFNSGTAFYSFDTCH